MRKVAELKGNFDDLRFLHWIYRELFNTMGKELAVGNLNVTVWSENTCETPSGVVRKDLPTRVPCLMPTCPAALSTMANSQGQLSPLSGDPCSPFGAQWFWHTNEMGFLCTRIIPYTQNATTISAWHRAKSERNQAGSFCNGPRAWWCQINESNWWSQIWKVGVSHPLHRNTAPGEMCHIQNLPCSSEKRKNTHMVLPHSRNLTLKKNGASQRKKKNCVYREGGNRRKILQLQSWSL